MYVFYHYCYTTALIFKRKIRFNKITCKFSVDVILLFKELTTIQINQIFFLKGFINMENLNSCYQFHVKRIFSSNLKRWNLNIRFNSYLL